jgi:hypothetical protein
MLSKAGGNATAGGVSFQASVGAVFAAQLLTETPLDARFELGGAMPRSIRFESEAPLDDIAVGTDAGGWLLVQAKTSFSLSASLTSDLGKTAEQIARQWHLSVGGTGKRGWDRPLEVTRDRFVIAAGPNSARTVTHDLAKALASRRASYSAPLPQNQKVALGKLSAALKAAWKKVAGKPASAADISKLLPFLVVISYDMLGADRTAAIAIVRHAAAHHTSAASIFVALERQCQHLMTARLGGDAVSFRRSVSEVGIGLKAPPSYQGDVENLQKYSDRIRTVLEGFEETNVSGVKITVPRKSTDAVVAAAKEGSLLIIGEPGAGKSAVVSAAAARLRDEKYDVIELAVDRLPVDTADGLKGELGLSHRVLDVLENWPGTKPAFLFIDALDATRGGRGEAVFRALMADVMDLTLGRWRVIPSIRSFDLRLGEEFRLLFSGKPADEEFTDPSFRDVRHINVPPWSDAEFEKLLSDAPELATAIQKGGQKLRDLASVPFNTRLLAELISGGTSADAFDAIKSQVELLALYWRKRVTQLGAGADLCLRAAVSEMVTTRSLRAAKLTAATPDAVALDNLLKANVLAPIAGDRYVGFRHHILFDYAASRLFIDPMNIMATANQLRTERGLSLMLAPALAFTLQYLWVSGTKGHQQFWNAAVIFAGDSGSDPVARSVAARMACELPESSDDMDGLVALLDSDADRERALKAFSHFVGAVTVRIGDKMPLNDGPWCYLASQAQRHIGQLAWPLRSLLSVFVKRTTNPIELGYLGGASRTLLEFTLSGTSPASQLTPIAIELVADTYLSDAMASRELLSRLMTEGRLATHAHQDMPALARQAKLLLNADPEFLIEIYRVIFGYRVTDTASTSMGQSQILSLSSNKKQDYDQSQWQLKEVITAFLEQHPEQAVRAIVAALESHARSKYASTLTELSVTVEGRNVTLIEDTSYAWAHDPDDRYAYADNIASIILAFKKRLETASDAEAAQIITFTIQHNKLAVLWARMFLVGTKRPETLGRLLWPYASATAFLRSSNTGKDAIDVISATYPLLDEVTRRQFEDRISTIEFTDVENPQRSRLRFLATLFRSIGKDRLATDAASSIIEDAEIEAVSTENRRSLQIFTSFRPVDPYWYFRDNGVDIDAPANAALLGLVEALDVADDANETSAVALKIERLTALSVAIKGASASSVAQLVVDHAEDSFVQGLEKLAKQKEELRLQPSAADALRKMVVPYLKHPRPNSETDLATSGGPRSYAVEAALHLCAISEKFAREVVPEIEVLKSDLNVAVRLAFADSFGSLWEFDRPSLWRIAEYIARHEQDSTVLRSLTGFLCRAVHADPPKIEELTFLLLPRARTETDVHGDSIVDAIGSITAVLWMQHDQPRARQLLDEWLLAPGRHEAELRHAVGTLRDSVVAGYVSGKAADIKLRERAQLLAKQVVDVTSAGLGQYMAMSPESRTDVDHGNAGAFAKLLDYVGDQLYFSSGAFQADEKEQETGLVGVESKRAFLDDTSSLLSCIGDVGTPHTIFYLIDMLDFLRPADPARVFDLVAHALLEAGRKHGYQFESLGSDRFVEVVGVFLADHRDIFKDTDRRERLISCLDVFVEAGWPSARRLLYRLPELL